MQPPIPSSVSRYQCRTPQSSAGLWLAGLLLALLTGAVRADDFMVISGNDQGDANPGDGICATTGPISVCTLRAAVEESNALAGADRAFMNAGTFTLASELLIEDDLMVHGAGARSTTIRSDGGAPNRLFHVDDATVSLSLFDLKLQGGDAGSSSGDGGAVRSKGTLQVTSVWFDQNVASSCGAIRAMGETLIQYSTFTSNEAAGGGLFGGDGGALCVANGGEAEVLNTTFVANSAVAGGAIVISHLNSELALRHATLVDNIDRDLGGGDSSAIDHRGADVLRIERSLVVGTCMFGDDAVVLSEGGNAQSPGSSCLVGGSGDQPNLTLDELHLGTLGDYGGHVPTVLPGTLSVAVDPPASTAPCHFEDARGLLRDAQCDAGAVERQPGDPESGPFFADGFESGDTSAW